MLMSVSQYAEHAGMSRRAFYNWESRDGFPGRVDGKVDQSACDAYLARYRDRQDQRIQNAKSKPASGKKARQMIGNELVEMSVAEIKQHLAECVSQAASMNPKERAALAAKAVGLYLSEGPDNPPMTFGGYRLATNDCPRWEPEIVAGGAFGLFLPDVVFECRDYALTLMSDETEKTAQREVIPSLLYVLADDN